MVNRDVRNDLVAERKHEAGLLRSILLALDPCDQRMRIVPLPAAIQVETVFSVALVSGTRHGDVAAQVVRVLTSPEAALAYERSGASPAF